MADPLERLTNLVALLLETRVPLTQAEIVTELRCQYPESESGRRAAFERDKAHLRDLGSAILTEVLGADRAGATGYRIDRKQFELGDLGLSPDEREALQVAVAAVHLGAAWGDDAIAKLGGHASDGAGSLAAVLPALDNLPALFDAVSARRHVEFEYHGKARRVEPWGLLARGGFWYLVGHDGGTGLQRTYRVDRIEGEVTAGPARGFDRPAGFDPSSAFPTDTKAMGDSEGPAEALVAVDADRARAVVLEHGEDAVAERKADGSVVVRVPCRNMLVFRGWLLGFVEHAEVLEPPEVRAEITRWLQAMVARG
jgi:predicted DNA-binding transcriptional regulator YafY